MERTSLYVLVLDTPTDTNTEVRTLQYKLFKQAPRHVHLDTNGLNSTMQLPDYIYSCGLHDQAGHPSKQPRKQTH